MNRLILIGNGFDLAHNMKTSYSDFLFWYFKSSFQNIDNSGCYEDKLMRIRKNNNFDDARITGASNVKQYLEYARELQESGDIFFLDMVTSRMISEGNDKSFTLTFKNSFFRSLIYSYTSCNWVDIENHYYEYLKLLLNEDSSNKEKYIKGLNDSLGLLIEKLQAYLIGMENKEVILNLNEIFSDPIELKEFVGLDGIYDVQPYQVLFLNFNYTKTVEYYSAKIGSRSSINYIHGQIGDKQNPIIFGFGDEIDEDYKSIESQKSKGFLSYIKSFGYFINSNYHNLVRFIDSNDYQVFILGHSCGLSDRTMLNMIFEHSNCKSIKVFYHQQKDGNNFKELTQEISRHFKDKGMMRRKLVSFDKSIFIPQISHKT